MRRPLISILAALFVAWGGPRALGGDTAPPKRSGPTLVREIYVPFAELNVLLEDQPRRVLLSRKEYEELLVRAKTKPEDRAPLAAALVSSDTTIAVAEDRAQLTATLVADVLEDGLHALLLDLGGVGLRRATLDGKPAAIGRLGSGCPTLFVSGRGRHTLILDMVAPLQTTAAQQVLNLRLPRPPAARMRMTVSGDVEIKSGAEVVGRVVDKAARVTRFELVPRGGDTTVVMTLNSHLLRQERVVTAKSVVVCEVTRAYERLHATVTLDVLHRTVDGFRFALPDGFDVTHVDSPLLARWNIVADGPRRVLEVKLREQTGEMVVLRISAERTPARLGAWTMPRLRPLDVVGDVTVLGLVVEDRLQARSIVPTGLVRIETDVPTLQALPETIRRAAPGTPSLVPVVAYYAPQSKFGLTARFARAPSELAVTSTLLLALGDRQQEVFAALSLTPSVEKLFAIDFSVPAGWQVDRVTAADETPLAFERHGTAQRPGRIHVRLPRGIAPNEQYQVRFHARSTPAGWLGDWRIWIVEFPVFALAGATRDVGAVAVAARDDLAVRMQKHQRLVPLDESEKERFGLGDAATDLAYRYEGHPYGATLEVERTPPRVTARTFSFLQVAPDVLTARHELIYDIAEARTRRLALLLPPEAPKTISIRALDGLQLKESVSEKAPGGTRWNVLLAEPRRGTVRLTVDFQQPLPVEKAGDVTLPLVRAGGVAYQTGLIAVEGSAELDVEVATSARRVDVGELVDAEYQPGKRLLGVYGFVGDAPEVKVHVVRQPAHRLYPAIVQKAELTTSLSADGTSQTWALFELRTKALFLEVGLPDGSTLWSAELDGKPIKPQRQDQSVLVGLPAAGAGALRRLQIVYQTPVDAVALSGRVELPAPELRLRAEADAQPEKVPLVELRWKLRPPSGYEVIGSRGTVAPVDPRQPEPAAVSMAKVLYVLAGGTPGPFFGTMSLSGGGMDKAKKSSPKRAATPGLSHHLSDAKSDDSDFFEYTGKATETEEATTKGDQEMPEGAMAGEEDEEKEVAKTEAPRPALVELPPATIEPAKEPLAPPRKLPLQASTSPAGLKFQLEDLLGVSSLRIELGERAGEDGPVVVFESLGEDPVLDVALADGARLNTLGWALAMIVALGGLVLTGRTIRAKSRYVLAVAAVATVVPVLPGCAIAAGVANMAFHAAVLLVPYYLAATVVGWLARGVCRLGRAMGLRKAATAAATVLLAAGLGAYSHAADAPKIKLGPYQIQLVGPPRPVAMPDDAVLLPYDPDSKTGIRDANRVMVPYAKYVELWNRAYPDKKLEAKAPPAPYALAGASYTARLTGDEYLLVEGQLAIDVHTEGRVTVPLGLGGGVLIRAELGGQPARISTPAVDPGANAPNAPAQQQKPQQQKLQAVPPGRFVLLELSGKGRHELKVAVRMRLARHGGWRVAAGVLPSAPATALTLTVPDAQTEVRLSGIDDRRSYDTERAGRVIETALGGNGAVGIQWRPKVARGQVDRSLTVRGRATLDVQEDGLRLLWKFDLGFPRGQRERFSVNVPLEYLVEDVSGGNVRGWNVRADDKTQTVEVSLLKPAKDRESFAVQIWRKGPVGTGTLDRFAVPVVSVPEAALQNGRVTIRRSKLLDVRIQDTSGVKRTDLSGEAAGAKNQEVEPAGTATVLVSQPLAAFEFVSVPFSIELAAQPVAARTSARVRTVLNITDYEQNLESHVRIDVRGRPLYRAEILLPEGLSREHVTAPGRFQWVITSENDRRLLTLHWAEGQEDGVAILVKGKLTAKREDHNVPLPAVELRGVDRQQGEIAVQVDRGVNVEARGLVGCETVLLSRVGAWLNPGQLAITRLAIRYRQPGYGGTLALSFPTPEVACTTVSNVRVTSRAVEETVMLDFTVRKAGVRELSFLLPADMADSRFRAPQLRQKTIEPMGEKAEGMVRARLELQDEIMGQIRVAVLNDRLVEQDREYSVPIPVVETGRTDRQFAVIESAGRDEVVPGEPRGLESLSRQQKEWKTLGAYKLGGITRAYVATDPAARPRLTFRTRRREVVRTAGASIGLARTDLVMDAGGAFRAEQVYHVNNRTEQFLEIALPPGARLWTAQVAGQPVKPTEAPRATAAVGVFGPDWIYVRVPLIKTERGDRDYEVRLVYGGRGASPGNLRKTEFPLVRTVNVNVQRSQVRLYLPEQYRWYDFGGTMGRVEDEGYLAAQDVDYQNEQAKRLMQTVREDSSFARVRAANSLLRLGVVIDRFNERLRGFSSNPELQEQLGKNASVLDEAQQEVERIQSMHRPSAPRDNRGQLNELFEEQKNTRARNVIQDAGGNWSEEAVTGKDGQRPRAQMFFNNDWLDRNKLANPEMSQPKEMMPEGTTTKTPDRSSGKKGGDKEQAADAAIRYKGKSRQAQPAAQPQAASIAGGKLGKHLRKPASDLDSAQMLQRDGDATVRYQKRLEQGMRQQREMDRSRALAELEVSGAEAANLREKVQAARSRLNGLPRVDEDLTQREGHVTLDLQNRRLVPLQVTADGRLTPPDGGPVVASGLTSLSIELPKRGRVFLFTTPGGDLQVTARSASHDAIRALLHAAVVLVVLAVAAAVFRMGRRGRLTWLGGRVFSTLLIALGMIAMALGIFPIAGLAAIAAGVGVKIHRVARGKCRMSNDE